MQTFQDEAKFPARWRAQSCPEQGSAKNRESRTQSFPVRFLAMARSSARDEILQPLTRWTWTSQQCSVPRRCGEPTCPPSPPLQLFPVIHLLPKRDRSCPCWNPQVAAQSAEKRRG